MHQPFAFTDPGVTPPAHAGSDEAGRLRRAGRPATGSLREIRSRKTGEISSYSALVTYKGRRKTVRLKATERQWAEADMARIVEEIRRDVWIEPRSATPKSAIPLFADFAQQWLARQVVEGGRSRSGLAPATAAELGWALRHLLPTSPRSRSPRSRSPTSITTGTRNSRPANSPRTRSTKRSRR